MVKGCVTAMAIEKNNLALLHLLCILNRHMSVGGGYSGELSEIIQNNASVVSPFKRILNFVSQA